MTQPDVDRTREDALGQIGGRDRNLRTGFGSASVVEVLFLGGYLLLMDHGEKTHWLILIAAVAVYMMLAMGLLALGVYTDRAVLRVLKAVEALAERLDGPA